MCIHSLIPERLSVPHWLTLRLRACLSISTQMSLPVCIRIHPLECTALTDATPACLFIYIYTDVSIIIHLCTSERLNVLHKLTLRRRACSSIYMSRP